MKPWDGRFTEKTREIVDKFNSSINFDKRLYREDIQGSIAHCKMLVKQGIITIDEGNQIIDGLTQILNEIETGKFNFKEELEDIHMNIEARLIELIGDTGGKLHTARSRNDQVSLDIKMYVRNRTKEVLKILIDLITVFNKKAEENLDICMPGFTHLQQAQPILLSHYLLAYVEMFKRDFSRFNSLLERLSECPLGAGALAGTTFPIDRFLTANLLHFETPTNNSIDTVSDRDFIIEFISNSSVVMMHLSKLAEELILWSTFQFDFIEISDGFCTGSSIMPQKKNPDIPELIRGKTGRIYGNLVSILTTLKALPLAYNKDMQEDKEPLFDTVDTLKNSLLITIDMMQEIKFNKENLFKWASKGFSTATEIADYLSLKGMSFRNAHKVTGQIVKYCIDSNKELFDLSIDEFKRFSDLFNKDIFEYIKVESAVNRRMSYGGTAIIKVKEQIEKNFEFLKKNKESNAKT
jgi:argininosuccinate lyase